MRITKKKLVAAGAGAALALAGGGLALAYWTTSGGGTGSGSVGTSTAVTVSQVGTISGLTPGGNAQAIDFKINNPASTNQYIASVAVSISSVTDQNNDPAVGCSAGDFTVVQPSAINSDLTPGDHTYSPSGATLAMKNTTSNQDGCKNAKVNLAFSAS